VIPGAREIDGMLRWLDRGGARTGDLEVTRGEHGERGARARVDVHAGAPVITIPRRLLVTSEIARASEIGRAIASSGLEDVGAHTYLAAYLIEERSRPGSALRPYLDALPRSFPGIPLFFGPDELALLEGSFTRAKIEARRRSLRRDHRALRRRVPALASLRLGEFVWARLAVITRVFGLEIDGVKTEAMVPMADMLDHRAPPDTAWGYDEAAGAFVMTASRDLRAGEPVHDSYGRKGNGRFLVNYGFALEDNADDTAEVALAIPTGDPLLAPKSRALGGADRAFQAPARALDPDAQAMLSFLRIAHATAAELDRLRADPSARARAVAPISARNEATALGALAAACEEALGRFPTTAEEDDAILRGAPLSRNARHCILTRRGEKKVLHHWVALARAAIPMLRMPWERLTEAARAGHRRGAADLDDYLAAVVTSLAARRGAAAAPCTTRYQESTP
jgi:histone-lysine N-methyltransferase SETD3